MVTLLTIAPLLLSLACQPGDLPDEDKLARTLEGARKWLVAVFPDWQLPGEASPPGEESLRERMWRRWEEGGRMGRKYLGTGVAVSEDGEIITSNEVIPPGAVAMGIRFSDGRTGKAEVVARYERGNLALLRVEGEALDPAPLSARQEARPGEVVFTVGNVLDSIGIDGTPAISRGVIVRVGRASGGGRYRGWALETDAAINNGSYGGALLDLEGEVIGIVDPGYSYRRWLGQAIPIGIVREILPDLRKGWIPRHTIGLGIEAVPEGGVKVVKVMKGGPAEAAGLRPGDRLLQAEKREIGGPRDLDGVVARLPVGTPIAIRLLRGEETLRLLVRIGRR